MVLYCDICKKELNQHKPNFKIISITEWDYRGSGEDVFTGELCDGCLTKLNKWFKNKLDWFTNLRYPTKYLNIKIPEQKGYEFKKMIAFSSINEGLCIYRKTKRDKMK